MAPVDVLLNFSTAGLGGIFAWICVHPFNTVAIQMNLATASGNQQHMGFVKFSQKIIKERGLISLYDGLSAGIIRQIFYASTRFGLFEVLRDKLNQYRPTDIWSRLIAGGTAGGVAALISCPAEVTLVRISNDKSLPEAQRRNYKNLFDGVRRIAIEEGPKAFFSGSAPFINRAMLVGTVQVATYDQFRDSFRKLGIVSQYPNVFAACMASGLIYSVATMPFESAKNRMAFQKVDPVTGKKPYTSTRQLLMSVTRSEGTRDSLDAHEMGASGSVPINASGAAAAAPVESVTVALRGLPAAIEESIYVHERFPLIIDPSGQAARFLKYQMGFFYRSDDVVNFTPHNLNRALVGALQHGRMLALHFPSLHDVSESLFEPGMVPKELISRSDFYTDEVWQSIIHKEFGDPDVSDITPSPEFVFTICTSNSEVIPTSLATAMRVIIVPDEAKSSKGPGDGKEEGGDSEGMDAIAEVYSAKEVVRNSVQLVEAAFDGDEDEMKRWIDKGFHIESVDGRKHTALSEAACQGHDGVVKMLLDLGADPNTRSDTGRTPLWRAAFNGHIGTIKLLLEAGSDPEYCDTTSHENVFDVAKTDEVRAVLAAWDPAFTAVLKERRRQAVLAAVESRIRTQVERDAFARERLRQELVQLASTNSSGSGTVAVKGAHGGMSGGSSGGVTSNKTSSDNISKIREILDMMASEVEASSTDRGKARPRATAEARNDQGQTLLSIAAQRDDLPLATFLLEHWKTIDKDRWDLGPGEVSGAAKVFRANPNSRDMKGWNCACIAVFHNALHVLPKLLEHGADPSLRSSYNKNAWDLAKDELDAAGRVVQSRADIRSILQEHEAMHASRMFGKASVSAVTPGGSAAISYEGVDKDGTTMLMNIEINNEASREVVKQGDKLASSSRSKEKAIKCGKEQGQKKSTVKSKTKSAVK